MGASGGARRLFLALPLDADARAELEPKCASLLAFDALRLVPPENYHLTLHFFGDVPAAREAQVLEILTAAGNAQPTDGVALDLACFKPLPVQGDTRIVCATPLADSHPLCALTFQVRECARRAGFEIDTRPPLAHVTVARSQGRGSRWHLPPHLQVRWPEVVRARLGRVALLSSSRGGSGAIYDEVAGVWPHGGQAVSGGARSRR